MCVCVCVCVCVEGPGDTGRQSRTHTHTHTHNVLKKNEQENPHLLHCTETDHTVCRAITPLPLLCIYHPETNGLLALQHFNEPWGVCRKHIYQHSFISIHHHLPMHTHAHKKRDRGARKTL